MELTHLATNRRSSSILSRAPLAEDSFRGGLYKLKKRPGFLSENACASVAGPRISWVRNRTYRL